MKKQKKTTVKSVQAEFDEFKKIAKQFAQEVHNRPFTIVAEIEAATAEGKLNGLTVVELLTMVNMVAQQGRDIRLSLAGAPKTLRVWSEGRKPSIPYQLR